MKQQLPSRLARFEEKKLKTRLIFAVIGMLLVVTLLIVFGFRLMIGFFIFLDQMRGKNPTEQSQSTALVIPPYLDPLPTATMSGRLTITGRGQPNATIILYINDSESRRETIPDDGIFSIVSQNLPEGTYTIRAKTADNNGNTSNFSNTITTTIKKRPPILTISSPIDDMIVSGDDNMLQIEGKTDEGVDVRVNDRFVIVKSDGSFTYPYPLEEGENTLTIQAIDQAGNMTQVEKIVTYKKQ